MIIKINVSLSLITTLKPSSIIIAIKNKAILKRHYRGYNLGCWRKNLSKRFFGGALSDTAMSFGLIYNYRNELLASRTRFQFKFKELIQVFDKVLLLVASILDWKIRRFDVQKGKTACLFFLSFFHCFKTILNLVFLCVAENQISVGELLFGIRLWIATWCLIHG